MGHNDTTYAPEKQIKNFVELEYRDWLATNDLSAKWDHYSWQLPIERGQLLCAWWKSLHGTMDTIKLLMATKAEWFQCVGKCEYNEWSYGIRRHQTAAAAAPAMYRRQLLAGTRRRRQRDVTASVIYWQYRISPSYCTIYARVGDTREMR